MKMNIITEQYPFIFHFADFSLPYPTIPTIGKEKEQGLTLLFFCLQFVCCLIVHPHFLFV